MRELRVSVMYPEDSSPCAMRGMDRHRSGFVRAERSLFFFFYLEEVKSIEKGRCGRAGRRKTCLDIPVQPPVTVGLSYGNRRVIPRYPTTSKWLSRVTYDYR